MNAAGTAQSGTRTAGPLWAWAGAAAGLAGVVAVQVSGGITAAYDEESAGDVSAVDQALLAQADSLLALHTALMAATVLLPVFAAGLWRRLRPAVPGDSLLPAVAAMGLVLTAVATLLGSGLNTELYFGLISPRGDLAPEFALIGAHWVGTIPWLWVGAGITGVAVAAASLRYRAVPLWLGWTSALIGGLTLVAGISPLQYTAGYTGPVWVLIAGIGFALSRPAAR
ncbi:hypothetical protein [Actinocorallia populi]|uniref:hypothetical protein n=1 Tax=Actinocorallia populi TaxID=2079200 RepID=UPI000D092F6C|nr:hypothetical protein [Actinocorallia populi]